jgi:hypothetical protein
MLLFAILTSNPTQARNFLINRGIAQQITSNWDGTQTTVLVGVLPGLEWIEVPNPIIVNPGPPPVMDTRHNYLVKIAHESDADQRQGIDQTLPKNPTIEDLLNRTKAGKWVLANGTRDDQNVNGTIVPAYQIGAQQGWICVDLNYVLGAWL